MMLEYKKSTRVECVDSLLSEIRVSDIDKHKTFNVASAFDTEASSFYTEMAHDKVGLCYIWMFGIENKIVYGRDLKQFAELMTELNAFFSIEKLKLIVYVHNLKYDFQFIKHYFKWKTVFSKSRRDILYANMGNIEFRDSLVLAGGRSLAYIGKHLKAQGIEKAVGDLNYNLIRTSETPLTDDELHYCEMDIRVLIQYIREKIESDGGISKIPYTNTGYVRNYVRNECFRNRQKYMAFIDKLTMTPGCYQAAETAFMGGATGPNIKYIGKTFTEPVSSYDIKSSYPYVMATGYFPMSYGVAVPHNKTIEYLQAGKWCCLFTLEVFNLIPTQSFCFPISESKCIKTVGAHIGSGRVISAAYVKIICTELDLEIYQRFYDITWANMNISFMRVFRRGRLPKPIVASVIKFFHDKTTLDGIPDKAAEYMISKNMLNAVYGMMVEKPVRPDFIYKDGVIDPQEIDYVDKVVSYNDKYNRFLFYPWGVWVTAQARRRLYDAIFECGDDFIYCDTDSVKILNASKHQQYFDFVNQRAKSAMIECAKYLGVPKSSAMPKAQSGDIKVMGVWEKEWISNKFKTIGPKRYLIEFPNGKYLLTVAGVNKDGALKYILERAESEGVDPFDLFTEGLIIPKEYAKRLSMTFIEKPKSGYVRDYTGERRLFTVYSGIHAEPTDYNFTIPDYTKQALAMLLGDEYDEAGQIL